MNHRILLHRLTIAVAIGMLVAALNYLSDERSQLTASPLVAASSQATRYNQVERQGEVKAQNQQQRLSHQELAQRNAQLLRQQRRLAQLQSRF